MAIVYMLNFWQKLVQKHTMLDDRYRLEQPIGIGGFGAVYSASKVFEGRVLRRVAVKLITPNPRQDVDWQFRELEAAMRIRHHNLVTTFTVGRWKGVSSLLWN